MQLYLQQEIWIELEGMKLRSDYINKDYWEDIKKGD